MDHSLRSRSLCHILKGKNQVMDSLTWDYCRYILGLKRLVDFPAVFSPGRGLAGFPQEKTEMAH